MKRLNERKQGVKPDVVVYNPIDLFTKYKFNNSQFVNLGYIKEVEKVSNSLRTVANVNLETDALLSEYIEKCEFPQVKQRLQDFQDSDEYQALLAGTYNKKTVKLDLTNCYIVCVERFNFQWKDNKQFAKYYKDKSDKELNIRRKYGFSDGFNRDEEIADPDYEGSWRDDYSGGNIMPRPKQNKTNPYGGSIGVDNLYVRLPLIDKEGNVIRDKDTKEDELALRIIFNPKTKNTTYTNYFVDGNGNLLEVTPGLLEFLLFTYKGKNVNKAAASPKVMSAEEQAFVKEIEEIDHVLANKVIEERTLLASKILYVRGQVTPTRGSTKSSAIWINKGVVNRTFNFINPSELTKLIHNMTRGLKDDPYNETIDGYIVNANVGGKSISDLVSYDSDGKAYADPAAVRDRLGITEAIMNLYESYLKKKRRMNSLNESKQLMYSKLMRSISKMVQKELNITY